MSKEQIKTVIAKYLPEASVDVCATWIVNYNIHFKITKSRSSKFGDYRPMHDLRGHHITVNHDLNQYAFLITFTHEVAHLICELKHKRRIAPHGEEWKQNFSILLNYFLKMDIFPDDIVTALQSYIQNPLASSCSDHDLMRALRKYDKKETMHVHHLEDLPEGTLFRMYSSRSNFIFKKGEKMRTRFHCKEINSKREYVVSPLAEVVVHEVPQEGLQLEIGR